MKVLVTGSSGRIGRAICYRLNAHHDVVGYDAVPAASTQVVARIEAVETLAASVRGVDAVVHVAALHAPHVGVRTDAEFESVNVNATEALFRLAVEAGIKRFVFTSSTAVYGHASTPVGRAGWVNESTEPEPRTIYHRTKLAAEALLQARAADAGVAVTTIRMSRCFPEPAPSMAAYRLHRGIDARDVADAHAAALQLSPAGYRCFVVSGASPFVEEDCEALFADAPAVLRNREPRLVEAFAKRGWKLPHSIDRVYDSRAALTQLGWQARYGFAEVLAQLDQESSEVLAWGHE